MKHFFLTMFFAGILLFFQQQAGHCQTFTGSGGAIPDDGTTIEFSINVQGLVPSTIDTSSFGLETVCIDLTHTWDSDLDIRLIAPDGTSVVLTSGNGGSGHNYSVTCFNSHATEPVISGSAPFNGTYRPQGWLGIVNNGQNPNGIWTLRILDTYPWADTGTLHDWSITFGNDPSGVFTLDSSDIPIVVINTGGVPIPDEPKIHGMMGIIWHGPGNINYITDPFNAWYGHIGIEMRGSSSQLFPKKPYGFETRDEFGNNMNVQLLGMPIENDWVLIPNYSDKSLMRNSFTYDLARSMGYWAPRSRFCEVVVNGEYAGVYALMEKIKRDDDRVDILPMTNADISGDALTGGYIIKIDKWTGSNNDGWESSFLPMAHPDNQKINFLYHYPAPDSIVPAQKNYIQSFILQFESTLWGPQFNDPVNGYYQYIDMNSFIDFFIINELRKMLTDIV
jgi:subtilisin-like proprotein convertase family protein